MCSAWTSSVPSAVNRAAEQSARSLMLGLNAARRSTAPISSAMPVRRAISTGSAAGSSGVTSRPPTRSAGRRAVSTRAPSGPGSARQPSATQMVQSGSAITAGPTAAARGRRRAGRTPPAGPGGGPSPGAPPPRPARPGRAYPLRRSCSAGKSATDGTRSSWLWPAYRQSTRHLDLDVGPAAAQARHRLGGQGPQGVVEAGVVGAAWATSGRRRAGAAPHSSPTAESTPARGGTITVGHAQGVGEAAGVQRAGAPERDEREVPRVDAAGHRHRPHGLLHGRLDHGDDVVGRRPRRGRAPPGRPRRRARPTPGSSVPLGMRPGDEVGVGDRRLGATEAVAGGTGHGAGAARPDGERSARVDGRRSTRRRRRWCGRRATAGAPAARRPTARPPARARRPRTRHTSVLVPPMSKVTASGKPHASAMAAAAATPPAGPDSRSDTGTSAARSMGTSPPAEVITATSSAASASAAR